MTDKKSQTPTRVERVGYRNPPKSGQFVKGRSGNPQGRPRKPKIVGQATGSLSEYDAMFLEELNRQVSVREGDTVEKASVERAAMRAIALKAAKGDVKAYMAQSAKREAIENRRRAERNEFLKAMMEYKEATTQELGRRKATRQSGPEIIPHPDDIIIDPWNCTVTLNGPSTADQKMTQDMLMSRWPTVEREWRNSLPPIAKHPRSHREFERAKRQMEHVGRLVANRASRTNSWDLATPVERLEFLRRSCSETLCKMFPAAFVRSELGFRLAMRNWLGIRPTDEEQQAFLVEAREICLAA